jgi:hypothetical protein
MIIYHYYHYVLNAILVGIGKNGTTDLTFFPIDNLQGFNFKY